jgi:hypothetical protein
MTSPFKTCFIVPISLCEAPYDFTKKTSHIRLPFGIGYGTRKDVFPRYHPRSGVSIACSHLMTAFCCRSGTRLSRWKHLFTPFAEGMHSTFFTGDSHAEIHIAAALPSSSLWTGSL